MTDRLQAPCAEDKYLILPATNLRVGSLVPEAQPKPGLYWVFPPSSSGEPLRLYRLSGHSYPGAGITEPGLLPCSEVHRLPESIPQLTKKSDNPTMDIRGILSPATAQRPTYRDASTQTIDPPILELELTSKTVDEYFDIDRSTEWLLPRPRNPGLRMASHVHYGPVSNSSSEGTGRERVAFTPSTKSDGSREGEEEAERGFWERFIIGVWMACGNRTYM